MIKFRKRSGTTHRGIDYEDYLTAFLLLKLSISDAIEDFELSCNDREFDSFDDIVLTVYNQNQQDKTYAFQLKHVQNNNKRLITESFGAKRGDFSLQKYYESFKKLSSSKGIDQYILYTNLNFNTSDQTEFNLDGKNFISVVTKIRKSSEEDLLDISSENYVIKFEVVGNGTNEEEENEIEIYRKFFDKLCLFVNQTNADKMRLSIFSLFKDVFYTCDETFPKAFIEYVQQWSRIEGAKYKLVKQDVKMKIAEILLSPFIQTTSGTIQEAKAKILCNIIDGFDVTVAEDANEFPNLWSERHFDIDEGNKVGKRFSIITRKISNEDELNEIEKVKIFWHMDVAPMIIKVSSSNVQTVEKVLPFSKRPRKFLIVAEDISNNNFHGMKVFRDLTDLDEHDSAYENLLSHLTVSFQGRKPTSLGRLLEAQAGIRNLVTVTHLMKMLKEDFCIGTRKEKLTANYIPRSLFRNLIDFNCIKESNDVSVISCRGKLDAIRQKLGDLQLVSLEKYLKNETHLNNHPHQKDVLYHNKICSTEEFEMVCSRNPDITFHHFQITKKKRLEWLTSNGSVSLMRNYQIQGEYVPELEIFNLLKNKINIICGEAGMGKTVMISYLRNNFPMDSWIVSLNFREHFIKFKGNEGENILDFVFELESSQNKYNLFEKSVRESFRRSNKITILWDGFDELPGEDVQIALTVLRKLSETQVKQWITVRSYSKMILENEFNTFALNMKEVTECQIETYIRNRLSDRSREEVSEAVSKLFVNVASTNVRGILGIPLQLYMLTELLIKNSDKYLLLLNNISLTDMYYFFFEELLNFVWKKTSSDRSNSIIQLMYNHSRSYQLRSYEILSLKLNFDEVFRKIYHQDFFLEEFLREIKSQGDCLGIVSVNDSGSPTFLHNTFGEYFAALWLSKNFKHVDNLATFFFEQKHTTVRFMFDIIMAEDCHAHLAVLYKDIALLRKHKKSLHLKDKCGRNPLHLVCSWGERHSFFDMEVIDGKYIIEAVEECEIKEHDLEYKGIINYLIEEGLDLHEEDTLFKWNSIYYARFTLSLRAVDHLLSKVPSLSLNDVPSFTTDVCSVLWYAMRLNYPNLFKLIDNYPYFEEKYYKRNLLYGCTFLQRSDFVEHLLEMRIYREVINNKCFCINEIHILIEKTNLSSFNFPSLILRTQFRQTENTALHTAVELGYKKIVETLVKKGATVNETDSRGMTPLHCVACTDYLDIAKLLVEKGANVNETDNKGEVPLHVAVEFNKVEMARFFSQRTHYLVRNFNDMTPLDVAAAVGSLYLFKMIMESGCDNSNVNRTLLFAASWGQLEIITYLLNVVKVDINYDEGGKTALHCASANGHLDVVKFLIKSKATLNRQIDEDKRTELHCAAARGFLGIIKFLLKNKADLNIVDKNLRSPLHYAASFLNVFTFLCKKGANVNATDKNGNTALSLTQKSEQEVTSWCLIPTNRFQF